MVLPGWAVQLLGIGLALGLAALLWLPRRPRALEVLGAAFVAYPVARALLASALVSDRLTRYTVLLPASVQDFELGLVRQVSLGLLLPLAGALLLWRARVPREPARGWAGLRAGLARALEPAGVRLAMPARAAWAEALALLGVVLLLLLAGLAAQRWLVPFLVTGDESAYWVNLTPALLLGISLAAGLGEEFVWRGLLLRALMRRMPWLPALALQAALFGFIHAGYGNWAHVLGPAIFGALMGLVALRVSLLAAVVVHAGIDVAYLALAVPGLQPAILLLPAALLLAGLASAWRLRFAPVVAVLQDVPWLGPRLARAVRRA